MGENSSMGFFDLLLPPKPKAAAVTAGQVDAAAIAPTFLRRISYFLAASIQPAAHRL